MSIQIQSRTPAEQLWSDNSHYTVWFVAYTGRIERQRTNVNPGSGVTLLELTWSCTRTNRIVGLAVCHGVLDLFTRKIDPHLYLRYLVFRNHRIIVAGSYSDVFSHTGVILCTYLRTWGTQGKRIHRLRSRFANDHHDPQNEGPSALSSGIAIGTSKVYFFRLWSRAGSPEL